MEYKVEINKKNLLEVRPLRTECLYELLQFKKISIEFIKSILIMLTISLITIILLQSIYKNKVVDGNMLNLIISLISNYLFCILVPFVMFITLILLSYKIYLEKYAFLLNTFTLNIENNILVLKTQNLKINLILDNCSVEKYKDTLIICDSEGFKIFLPLNKIKDGETLEKEITRRVYGRNNNL